MEDDVLWLMVLAHATCLAVIPDRLYWYRRQRHGSVSQMLEAQERPLLLVAERLLHATEYWKKCGWAGIRPGAAAGYSGSEALSSVQAAESMGAPCRS